MKNYQKLLLLIPFLVVLVLALPKSTLAVSIEELNAQIQVLLVQIKQLQAQIQGAQQTTRWCHNFNANLKLGDLGEEIKNLCIVLQKDGFSINASDLGERVGGIDNGDFGESTASAVSGFQEKYRDEILTPLGLKYPTGYVGPSTRKALNRLYGCGAAPAVPATPAQQGITVLSPNGGEKWEAGKEVMIQWKNNGMEKIDGLRQEVQLVRPDAYKTIIQTIGYSIGYAETPVLKWTVNFNEPGNYLIRVHNTFPSGYQAIEDYSDVFFTIVSATSTAVEPFIDLIDPNSGFSNSLITIRGKNLLDTLGSGIRIDFLQNSNIKGTIDPFYISPDGSYLSFQLGGLVVENSGPGVYQVRVANNNGVSNIMNFVIVSGGQH